MAKARKKAKGTTARRGAAKRSVAKRGAAKRGATKARRVKAQAKKPARAKAKRAAPKKQKEGAIAGALHAVVDTVKETAALRDKLSGHQTFED